MNLYVIRHAEAVDRRTDGIERDYDRPLTEHGANQAHALGTALRERGWVAETVVSSPLVRTMQTTEQLLDAWGRHPNEIVTCDFLACGEMRRRKLSKFLEGLGVGSIAIVGHMPDLAEYLGWLLGTDGQQVPLEKAAAALVRFNGPPAKGDGELAWVVTPEWFMAPIQAHG